MSKARTLADFISDGSEFADGTISVAEVSGAAPLASPSFTGSPKADTSFEIEGADNAYLVLDETNGVAGGAQSTYISMQAGGTQTAYTGVASSGGIYYIANKYGPIQLMTGPSGTETTRLTLEESSGAIFNESGVDYDFRVESDGHTHALFVDAGNGRVGINNSNPESALCVGGDILSPWNNSGYQKIGIAARGSNTYSTTEKTLIITGADAVAGGQAMQGGDVIVRGGVGAGNEGLGIYAGHLYLEGGLHTGGVGTESGAGRIYMKTAGYERLNINQYGQVTINEVGDDADFRVESSNLNYALFVDAGNDNVGIGGTPNTTAHLDVTGSINGGYGGMIRLNNTGTSGCMGFIGVTDNNWGIGSGKLIIGRGTQGSNTSSALTELTFSDTEVVFNENSNDRDFRVESNNVQNMLTVDGGSDCVRIASGSNFGSLDVYKGGQDVARFRGNYVGECRFVFQNAVTANNGRGVELDFRSGDDNSMGKIITQHSGSTSNAIMDFVVEEADATPVYLRLSGGGGEIETYRTFVHNEGGNDYDFRVESDNYANMLSVDAGNDLVQVVNARLQFEYDTDPTVDTIRETVVNGKTYRGSYGQGYNTLWAKSLYTTISTTNRTFPILSVDRHGGNNRVWVKVTMRAAGAVANHGNEAVGYALINADGADASRTHTTSVTVYGTTNSWASTFSLGWNTSADPDVLEVTTAKNANYVALSFDIEVIQQDGNAPVKFLFSTYG